MASVVQRRISRVCHSVCMHGGQRLQTPWLSMEKMNHRRLHEGNVTPHMHTSMYKHVGLGNDTLQQAIVQGYTCTWVSGPSEVDRATQNNTKLCTGPSMLCGIFWSGLQITVWNCLKYAKGWTARAGQQFPPSPPLSCKGRTAAYRERIDAVRGREDVVSGETGTCQGLVPLGRRRDNLLAKE